LGLLPPARKLPDAINTLPPPHGPAHLSINKTFAPCSAARSAAVKPARPAPTTKTSEFNPSMALRAIASFDPFMSNAPTVQKFKTFKSFKSIPDILTA
jgi:hypothetical protein